LALLKVALNCYGRGLAPPPPPPPECTCMCFVHPHQAYTLSVLTNALRVHTAH
jgi:hypothetical protein